MSPVFVTNPLTLSPPATMLDPDKMKYPGGKNAAGVYQQIINQLPPHAVYVEPFLGSGAVLRLKSPAALSIVIERSAASLEKAMAAVTAKFGDTVRIVKTSDARSPIGSTIAKNIDAAGIATSSEECRRPSPDMTSGDARSAARMESRLQLQAAALAKSNDAGLRGPCARQPGCLAILGDARGVLPELAISPNWLIYADPPYLGSTRTRRYYQHEIFTDAEHRALLRLLKSLPCMIALSGYPSKLYDRELRAWRVHTFPAVNRAGEIVTECLWMNYPEPFELHDYTYLGQNFRERERIKRKTNRWINRLKSMPVLERASLFLAMQAASRSPTAISADTSRN